jgi:D-alanyl-D-alanine carboxypeptidase/D-alanyl-D-alanine-endopeptidase (penicillin-binding protein 4)
LLLSGLVVVLGFSAVATAEPDADAIAHLRSRLDKLLTSHGQPKVQAGARIIELPSGRVLYDYEGQRPLVPASNMKLLTLAAAVDRFGPDYEFKTILAARNKDLVVIGGGDPTIGDQKLLAKHGQSVTALFHEWAGKLKAAGVREIAGDIVIDDSIFNHQFVHPNWPADQFQRHYEAPVGGLNFGGNCVGVRVTPTKPGQRANASFVPGNVLLKLENRTITGAKQSVTAGRPPNSDTIVVNGTVAREEVVGPVTVRDPGLYFGHVLKTVLASEGIRVRGGVVRQKVRTDDGDVPKGYRVIAVHQTPLPVAMARAGKDSHGPTAEAIFKLVGSAGGSAGSWKTGHKEVDAFLRKVGVAEDEATVDDGSGLSRMNRISAAAMTQVLRYIHNAPGNKAQTLRSVLAVAGVDGTLEKRMRSPHTKGRIIAKTGYINGVRTLSGYVHTTSGEWLAFAFFFNQATRTRPLTQIQDEACDLLVDWPNIKPAANGQHDEPRGTPSALKQVHSRQGAHSSR